MINRFKVRNLELRVRLLKKALVSLSFFVLLIFAFAFAYYLLPSSFFHQNPQFDPAYHELKGRIIEDLCNYFQANVGDTKESCIIPIQDESSFDLMTWEGQDKGTLKAISFRVDHVASTNSLRVFFHYHIQMQKNVAKNMGSTGGDGDTFSVPLSQMFSGAKEISLKVEKADSVFIMNPPIEAAGSTTYTEFFKSRNLDILKRVRFYQNRNGLFLVLPMGENMLALATYLNHVPTKEPSFWKMVYFSTMTISGFGFGEVIPISYRARTLVAFQVIIGIFLFGFLITNLYDEYKTSHQRDYNLLVNREKKRSLATLWSNYYRTFLETAKLITTPLSDEPFNISTIKFSMLQNLYFPGPLNIMGPTLEKGFISYFENLDKISSYFKLIVASLDYETNGKLIVDMTKAIQVIEEHRFFEALKNRQIVKIGERTIADFDLEEFKKNPDVAPELLSANLRDLYVGIWNSLHALDSLFKEIDSELNH